MDADALVPVGKVVRAHGLKGGLIVRPASDGSDLLLGVEAVVLSHNGQRREAAVLEAKAHGRQVLLLVTGITDRNASEAVVGAELLVDRRAFPEAGDNAYWALDLVGLPVVAPSGEPLGQVVDVESSPVQDWLVVERDGGRHLVPLTAPLAKVEPGRVVVDAPEGLFEQ